jgi:SAM-dependent methyltransferase
MLSESFHYTGNELELFSEARNWKKYVATLIKPYISGNVLEAGAGIGTNTTLFYTPTVTNWVLLEPDKAFFNVLESLHAAKQLPPHCTVIHGFSSDIKQKETFDTIIYIDVIEHIEKDKEEVERAIRLLKKNGRLIILSPAHNFLMSPFDKAIGHFRRYSKKIMKELVNEQMKKEKIIYADSMGFFASMANKYLLKQEYPTKQQILFWDHRIIPVSKISDRILFNTLGKTVIGIWTKK